MTGAGKNLPILSEAFAWLASKQVPGRKSPEQSVGFLSFESLGFLRGQR